MLTSSKLGMVLQTEYNFNKPFLKTGVAYETGSGLENREAHPQQEFRGVRPLRYQSPFSHWRRIVHLQNPSKFKEKQMNKVKRVVHPKLRPFHFYIKMYYLSDANYNPSKTDNPSLV